MKNTLSKCMMGLVGLYIVCFSPFISFCEAGYWGWGGDSCCDGEYYAAIEALYWKPDHEPIFIARRSGPFSVTGDREETNLTGEHDCGVRACVGYRDSCGFYDIAYLYLCTDEKVDQARVPFPRMIIQGTESPTPNVSDFVKVKSEFKYQNVNVRYGKNLYRCGSCATYVYANARWVEVDFSENLRSIPPAETSFLEFLNQKADFNGGGVGIGLGGHCCIWQGLGLGANAGLMAIIGETRLKRYETNVDDASGIAVLSKAEKQCHTVPGIDVRLGLDYAFQCKCWTIEAEVGYELNYYFNILRYQSANLINTGGSARIPLFSQQDIGFSGPFFRLAVAY